MILKSLLSGKTFETNFPHDGVGTPHSIGYEAMWHMCGNPHDPGEFDRFKKAVCGCRSRGRGKCQCLHRDNIIAAPNY